MKRQRSSLPAAKRTSRSPAHQLVPIDEFIGNKILLLANLMGRSATIRYRRQLGLPHVSWRIIALLGGRPAMTLQELAGRAGLDKSQVCREVSGLVRRQLVSRQHSLDDRRERHLTLTERGASTYALLVSGARERHERLLRGISEPQRRLLLDLLDVLADRARELLTEEDLNARH